MFLKPLTLALEHLLAIPKVIKRQFLAFLPSQRALTTVQYLHMMHPLHLVVKGAHIQIFPLERWDKFVFEQGQIFIITGFCKVGGI